MRGQAGQFGHARKSRLYGMKGSGKVHIKKQALPAYQEWIDGITAAGTVQADDRVAATVIVWMIDCGLLDEAMPLADVLIHSGLESADEYSRSMPEIIVEQMADQIESGSEISAESLKTLIEWATAKKEDGLHEKSIWPTSSAPSC